MLTRRICTSGDILDFNTDAGGTGDYRVGDGDVGYRGDRAVRASDEIAAGEQNRASGKGEILLHDGDVIGEVGGRSPLSARAYHSLAGIRTSVQTIRMKRQQTLSRAERRIDRHCLASITFGTNALLRHAGSAFLSDSMSPRAFVSSLPLAFGHSVLQEDGIAWTKAALRRADTLAHGFETHRALRFYDRLAKTSAIGSRTTCLDDYTHQDWDRMRVHAPPILGDGQIGGTEAAWNRASLDIRMDVFGETALELARDAFRSDIEAPDLLVQVSCTGYDSPTAIQRVAVEKGWLGSRILHLGHMGCYAALPAVAIAAESMAARKVATVTPEDDRSSASAIFLVELCTLHHDPAATDVEQIVQQALFADGAVRVNVSSTATAGSFGLIDHAEVLIPSTLEEMTWRVADSAFRMTLSRRIPNHINDNLAAAVQNFLGRHGLVVSDVPWWAVHPGGPRVIESTAESLQLPEKAVRHSKKVFYERGNMSSTTIPHIWAVMADDGEVAPGDLVCSVAFGPGLTVAMNLMKAV